MIPSNVYKHLQRTDCVARAEGVYNEFEFDIRRNNSNLLVCTRLDNISGIKKEIPLSMAPDEACWNLIID